MYTVGGSFLTLSVCIVYACRNVNTCSILRMALHECMDVIIGI